MLRELVAVPAPETGGVQAHLDNVARLKPKSGLVARQFRQMGLIVASSCRLVPGWWSQTGLNARGRGYPGRWAAMAVMPAMPVTRPRWEPLISTMVACGSKQ